MLRLGRSLISVGRIQTKDWESFLPIYNDGSVTVQIKSVKPSCRCISATLEQNVVNPGDSTKLQVKGTQSRPGSFTYFIALLTNEASREVIQVPVRGYLEAPVLFEKPSVVAEKVSPNQKIEIRVPLILGDHVRETDLTIGLPGQPPFDASIEQNKEHGSFLRLHWDGVSKPGFYRYQVHVGSKGLPATLAAPLHFAVEVTPSVSVFPKSLLLLEAELGHDPWLRRLTLQGEQCQAITGAVICSDDRAREAIRASTRPTNDGIEIILTPQNPELLKKMEGQRLELQFRSGETALCKIPVYIGTRAFGQPVSQQRK